MIKKIKANFIKEPAITVNRVAVQSDTVVYIFVASKQQQYKLGKSRIIYVGTSKRGISRMASSMAEKADAALHLHGVTHFDVKIATCTKRQNRETWKILEHDLILRFRQKYGEVPQLNVVGKGFSDEFEHFTYEYMGNLIKKIEDSFCE